MANKQKLVRSVSVFTALLLVLTTVFSITSFMMKDAAEEIVGSIVKLNDKDIDKNLGQFIDSSTMYKLPSTVKDTDDISVIIRVKEASLLDAYEAGDRKMSFTDYVNTEEAKLVTGKINAERDSIIESLDVEGFDYALGADYKAIFGGFEVVIKAGDFEKLCRTVGDRATTIVGDEYNTCETQLVENKVNVYDTGIFNTSSFAYDGTGMVVAVLDTGLDYNHSAFSVGNFTADRNKLGMQLSDVESFISDTKASELHSGLTAADVYINEKVPFAFDYADYDSDVYPMTPSAASHGTHVAGVIAGKDDTITGVAPNAQLAIMKIFSDVVATARTAWILSALEDCVVLGVDVINMSIGTSCGFSRESDKEAISGVYDRIRATGISMVVAASNSFNSTYGSEKNGNLGLTSNPDSATVGSPSTYEGAMSVASISGKKTPYLLFGDKIIYFTESTDRVAEEKNFYDDIMPAGTNEMEVEYVTIPGAGRSADYTGLDVRGKVALVRRGSTTFEEKANVAQAKGAIGIIVYNNVSGEIKMNVGDATIGVCSISQDDGEVLAKNESGKLKIARSQASGPFMSDFSSWGPTPDLGIKPEITAHGGMIYSAVPGQSYDYQSGTSMASPNVAGATALIRQYVVENFPEIAGDPVKVTAFVNQLMMSTADIVYNTNGLPYAVRKQGAGLANLDNIANTTAYIITYRNDGSEMDKTKLELGDDPTKSGVYTLSFAVKNFGTTALTYDVSACVITEGVSDTKTKQGETTVDELGYILSGAKVELTSLLGATSDGMKITVGAGATANLTVTITLSDADKKYLDDSFENGMYVEGFVTLDAAEESIVDLSVPYLAFYGDWTVAPIFDLDYYATNKDELDDSIDLLDKTLPDAYASRPIGGVESDFVTYLGSFYFIQNPATTQIAADRKYISLSNQVGSVHELSNVWAGLLRNCAKIVVTITDDATGEVVYEKINNDVRKSYGDGGSIYPADVKIDFDVAEKNLNNNSTYTVKLQAYLDYGDGGEDTNLSNTFEFPLTIDFEAPAVTDCEFYTEYDKSAQRTRLFAKIAVYDNHYSMALQIGYLRSGTGGYVIDTFDQYLTPVYSEKNSTTYVVYELTDYIDEIKENAYVKNSFTIATYDYALNSAIYEIPLPDEFDSFYFEEETLILSPNQVYTLKPMAYPGTEWTELLNYVSTNTKVAHIVGNKVVTDAPGQAVIIARDPNTNNQVTLNLTVLDEDEEGYVKYDKPVTDDFVLTGYLTNKAFYQLSSEDRDIGSVGAEMKFSGAYALSMYPSESVTLRYRLNAYYPNITEVVVESGNDSLVKVTKVNGEWVITAVAEGFASVNVTVLMDGKSTYYSQTIDVEVKDPYITTGPSLTHYFGLGGRVEIPGSLAITDIGQFAFSNFDYVDKGPDDEISEDDPTNTKQWFLGENTIEEVIIPEGVKTINSYAFANLTALKKVVLPSTLERIDFGAFYGCSALTEVVGIEKVKFINRSAFEGCALKGSINLDSAVAIADRAFAGNQNLVSVVLGADVQSVASYAFSENRALKSVTIKAPIIKLGQYAFDFCVKLEEISINAVVIPTAAFNECTSLKKINLGKDVAVISEYAFSNASATSFTVDSANTVFAASSDGKYLTNKAGTEIMLLAPGIGGDLVIDDSNIISVGMGAFSGNNDLKSVKIPSVTNVSDYAFAYCEKLETVELGALEHIGRYAFYRTAIKSVPSLELIDRISDYAFAYSGVTSLTVRDGMTIGKGAFRECKALATVNIGNNVTIEADAFRLDRETNFVSGSYEGKDGYKVYYFIYTSALTSLTIGNNADIGNSAFMGAAKIESIVLGDNAVIGDSAFFNTASLKSIDLSKAKYIGDSAFSGDVVYEFTDENMTSPLVGEDREYVYRYYAPAFTSVDLSSVEDRQSKVDPRVLEPGIGEGAFEFCRSLTSVTLGENTTAIPTRAFNLCINLSTIDLSGVVSIGDNAFCETTLKEVDLTSATTIEKYAFVYNEELTKVTFGAENVILGEGAFSYCYALSEVEGSAKLSEIGAYAFTYTAITSIDLSGATSIGDFAFMKKEKDELTPFEVKITANLTNIGDNPFAMCKLEKFETTVTETFGTETFTKVIYTYDLSDTIKIIDGMIYKVVPNGLEFITYAGDEKTVNVADGTVRISSRAFMNSGVTRIVFPYTLYSIGHKAFFACDDLAMVSFASYEAPVLEEEYDYEYWLSGENYPSTVGNQYVEEDVGIEGLGIVPYFIWNFMFEDLNTPTAIYYGANFCNYVGRVDQNVTMVRPVNGIGYDSFILDHYFTLSVEGGAAADAVTLAAIDAINRLPATITLKDKALVMAAKAAYDKITSGTQRDLVYNYETLRNAEQMILDLEHLAGGNKPADPTDPTVDSDTNIRAILNGVIVAVVILSVCLIALVVYLIYFIRMIKKGGYTFGGSAKEPEKKDKDDRKSVTSDDVAVYDDELEKTADTADNEETSEPDVPFKKVVHEKPHDFDDITVGYIDKEAIRKKRKLLYIITGAVGAALVIAIAVAIILGASKSKFDNMVKEGYTVSVTFDSGGGTFKGSDSSIIDLYKPEEIGTGGITILAPDDARRNKNNIMTVTKAGYFLAGWYRNRSLVDENDPSKGYTYSGKWDFENDKLTVDPDKRYDPDESVLTLYAAWIPYYTFEIYADGDMMTPILTTSALNLTIPEWKDGDVILSYGNFPQREGYTLKDVYKIENGVMGAKIKGSCTGEWDEETATSKTPVIKLYTEWDEGKRYRIYSAEDLIANADLNGYYEIYSNLYFTNKDWPKAFQNGEFNGKIIGDGTKGKKIANVSIESATNNRLANGLFASIGKDARIENIAFENITHTIDVATVKPGTFFGLFAASVADGASFSKVTVSGKLLIGDTCASLVDSDVSISKLVVSGDTSGITANITVEKKNEADSSFDLVVDDDGDVTIVTGSGE